ncbi:MAG: ExbD/TolR family protein [Rhodospirillaceae bacterium]
MGAQLTGRSGGGRSRRKSWRPMSEINVTPFVDVMLVLLIVFMVTAPLLTVGIPVDLPKANAPPIATEEKPLFVTVKPDGSLYLQESRIELAALLPKLKAITGANAEARIMVRGDRSNTYGRMVEVLGTISAAGYKKIGLVADSPGSTPTKDAAAKPPRSSGTIRH